MADTILKFRLPEVNYWYIVLPESMIIKQALDNGYVIDEIGKKMASLEVITEIYQFYVKRLADLELVSIEAYEESMVNELLEITIDFTPNDTKLQLYVDNSVSMQLLAAIYSCELTLERVAPLNLSFKAKVDNREYLIYNEAALYTPPAKILYLRLMFYTNGTWSECLISRSLVSKLCREFLHDPLYKIDNDEYSRELVATLIQAHFNQIFPVAVTVESSSARFIYAKATDYFRLNIRDDNWLCGYLLFSDINWLSPYAAMLNRDSNQAQDSPSNKLITLDYRTDFMLSVGSSTLSEKDLTDLMVNDVILLDDYCSNSGSEISHVRLDLGETTIQAQIVDKQLIIL